MKDLTAVLSGLETGSQPVVRDMTNLSGRYDFVLYKKAIEIASSPQTAALPAAPDPLSQWDVEELGFKFKKMKASLPTIVVDRISAPTPN
jgi:uncharacterized protein (TIGR03435 family)